MLLSYRECFYLCLLWANIPTWYTSICHAYTGRHHVHFLTALGVVCRFVVNLLQEDGQIQKKWNHYINEIKIKLTCILAAWKFSYEGKWSPPIATILVSCEYVAIWVLQSLTVFNVVSNRDSHKAKVMEKITWYYVKLLHFDFYNLHLFLWAGLPKLLLCLQVSQKAKVHWNSPTDFKDLNIFSQI